MIFLKNVNINLEIIIKIFFQNILKIFHIKQSHKGQGWLLLAWLALECTSGSLGELSCTPTHFFFVQGVGMWWGASFALVYSWLGFLCLVPTLVMSPKLKLQHM
jgi:hypothetical protein